MPDKKFNPFTKKLDYVISSAEVVAIGDVYYLRLDCSNDPLTGQLTITPSSGGIALKANKAIEIKAGERLYLDGA